METGLVWPRNISQIKLGYITSGLYALGTPKLLWKQDKQKLIKKFHFQSDLELFLLLKNHFPEVRKKFRFHFIKLRGILRKSYIFGCFSMRTDEDLADSAFGGGEV